MTAAQRAFVNEPQEPENLTETLVQKARKLAPTLRQRAAATTQTRQVPRETIEDYWDAGLWYLLKPKKFGGPEYDPI